MKQHQQINCSFEFAQAPPFRAFISLAVPGPDIHAEAHDHTAEAAWLKVADDLRKQIERRKNRQDARLKSDRQSPALVRGLARRMAITRT